MSAVPQGLHNATLQDEWARVELLVRLMLHARQGQLVDQSQLDELDRLQALVNCNRAPGSIWERLLGAHGLESLSELEYDLLATAIAVEAEPRVGWLVQNAQAGSAQPYPTTALLQDMLALPAAEVAELHHVLGEDAPLRRAQLIENTDGDIYAPIRPARGVTASLLGWRQTPVAPPGSQRVRSHAGWDDLVLPQDRLQMLREFLLWIRHREQVVEQWGGVPSGGPVALFTGASGTGKTLAAAVLANELGWPLYRVDLGRLVSKYVGETEKNLNRLFDAAHRKPMVLQFDEADSLFSKRGEVKEARDRYANMEVSHLLARIEDHQGPCILTTNLREQLDPAFARRFQMVINFPRPDEAARIRLWSLLLPPRAPREPDVLPAFLGAAVSLTGGGIRNAAMHAAFLAAGAGQSIGLAHIAVAVLRELAKDGRQFSLNDLGTLQPHLPQSTAASADAGA